MVLTFPEPVRVKLRPDLLRSGGAALPEGVRVSACLLRQGSAPAPDKLRLERASSLRGSAQGPLRVHHRQGQPAPPFICPLFLLCSQQPFTGSLPVVLAPMATVGDQVGWAPGGPSCDLDVRFG